MATINRAAVLTKAHKVLKKHYSPVSAPTDRSTLDHLLFGCCLENAPYDKAEDAFAQLQETYFDRNEVRVTTVTELSEGICDLPDATSAATHLKRALQSIFETYYTFDLEHLRKQNLGVSVKELAKIQDITPFVLSYVTQHALGGHSIPIDAGAFEVLLALGVAHESDRKAHRAPGLERAVPKAKGIEFGSLLHQLAADFHASPFSPRVRNILVEISPDAKQRLPKRTAKQKEPQQAAPAKSKKAAKPQKSETAKKAATPTKSTKKKKEAAPKKAVKVKKKAATKRVSKRKPR